MNYFKFLITEKIPYRLFVIVLLLLNMLFNNTNNVSINVNEEIKKHKEIKEEMLKEPKILIEEN
ncbi:hypothetical protein AMRN_0757 [Malaciobacter marinus]|uniref:Uncharacterized protein n=1 Tax=Malaciobacter marinus TaxID=505249 RepID=A0A347TIT3_9BACT|nr:hypothetical protein [Malaciobacter marinus]AXX86511.1 hypothetical protein AMRN_0757 [Malaciobacter marinus]PHO14089.1 hypothetical protein CPH92_13715 [Malaciobacter marinus]